MKRSWIALYLALLTAHIALGAVDFYPVVGNDCTQTCRSHNLEAINGDTNGQALCQVTSAAAGGSTVYGTKWVGTGCRYAKGTSTFEAPNYLCGCGVRSELPWSYFSTCAECGTPATTSPYICRARATSTSDFVLGWLLPDASYFHNSTCYFPAVDGRPATSAVGFSEDMHFLCHAPGCNCRDGLPGLRLLPNGTDMYYSRACESGVDNEGKVPKCKTFYFTGRRQMSSSCSSAACLAEIEWDGTKHWIVDHSCERQVGLYQYICEIQRSRIGMADDPICAAGAFTLVPVTAESCVTACQAQGLAAVPTGTDATQGAICADSPTYDNDFYFGNWHPSDGRCYLQIDTTIGPWFYDSGITSFYCACTADSARMKWSTSSSCTPAAAVQERYPMMICRFHAYQQSTSKWVVGWILNSKCVTHTIQYGPASASITDAGPIGNPDYDVQALCDVPPGPCKSLGATGCTATGSAACCVGQALTCAIASGASTGTCAKRPTLAAAPITSVGFGVASGAVTATVRLAAAPVANNNYAAVTTYKVTLTQALDGNASYAVLVTSTQTSVAFKEGITLLSTGSMLPAGSLCGRTFKAQLGAKNAAGWSATYTTSATYIMPACPLCSKLSSNVYCLNCGTDGHRLTCIRNGGTPCLSDNGIGIPLCATLAPAAPNSVSGTCPAYISKQSIRYFYYSTSSTAPWPGGGDWQCTAFCAYDVAGYAFFAGKHSTGSNIGAQRAGLSAQQLASLCNNTPGCVGFTSAGYLKSALQPFAKWTATPTQGACDGIFVRQCSAMTGNLYCIACGTGAAAGKRLTCLASGKACATYYLDGSKPLAVTIQRCTDGTYAPHGGAVASASGCYATLTYQGQSYVHKSRLTTVPSMVVSECNAVPQCSQVQGNVYCINCGPLRNRLTCLARGKPCIAYYMSGTTRMSTVIRLCRDDTLVPQGALNAKRCPATVTHQGLQYSYKAVQAGSPPSEAITQCSNSCPCTGSAPLAPDTGRRQVVWPTLKLYAAPCKTAKVLTTAAMCQWLSYTGVKKPSTCSDGTCYAEVKRSSGNLAYVPLFGCGTAESFLNTSLARPLPGSTNTALCMTPPCTCRSFSAPRALPPHAQAGASQGASPPQPASLYFDCSSCPQFPREYDFTRLHDSYYHDLFQCSTCSLQQLYLLCNTIPECMGFNTQGWLKARINTLHLTGSRCQGIYIKINPSPPRDGIRLANQKFEVVSSPAPYVKVSGRLEVNAGSGWSTVCNAYFSDTESSTLWGDQSTWGAAYVEAVAASGFFSRGAFGGDCWPKSPSAGQKPTQAPSPNSQVACSQLGYAAMNAQPGGDLVAVQPGTGPSTTYCCSGARTALIRKVTACTKKGSSCPHASDVGISCRIPMPLTSPVCNRCDGVVANEERIAAAFSELQPSPCSLPIFGVEPLAAIHACQKVTTTGWTQPSACGENYCYAEVQTGDGKKGWVRLRYCTASEKCTLKDDWLLPADLADEASAKFNGKSLSQICSTATTSAVGRTLRSFYLVVQPKYDRCGNRI